jgi:hypothetical protein
VGNQSPDLVGAGEGDAMRTAEIVVMFLFVVVIVIAALILRDVLASYL